MSAKSEVVTICSRQSVGEERLQSTAMTLITTGAPVAAMGFGAADRMTYRCLVMLLPDRISSREDAVIYREGFPNQAGMLALGL